MCGFVVSHICPEGYGCSETVAGLHLQQHCTTNRKTPLRGPHLSYSFLYYSSPMWGNSPKEIKICRWVYLGYQSYVKPLWTTFKIQLAFSNRSVFSADLSWLEWKELFSSGRSMPGGLGHTPCPSVDMADLTANIRWAPSPPPPAPTRLLKE